jgi:hypothetical protein
MALKSVTPVLFRMSEASPFRTCQWPFGHPGEDGFHFCGKKTFATFSYCKEHAEMAYRAPEPRRDSAAFQRRQNAA